MRFKYKNPKTFESLCTNHFTLHLKNKLHVQVWVNVDAMLQTYENTLKTLVCANPGVLVSLVARAKAALSDANLLRVTQDEYFTYLTPPGQLYDKSVLPGWVTGLEGLKTCRHSVRA